MPLFLPSRAPLRASLARFRYNLPAPGSSAIEARFASILMVKTKKALRKQVAASRRAGLSAAQAGRELEELNRIGIALSETRDVEHLLALILSKAREITGADAGSLYLVEQAAGRFERSCTEKLPTARTARDGCASG